MESIRRVVLFDEVYVEMLKGREEGENEVRRTVGKGGAAEPGIEMKLRLRFWRWVKKG